MAGLLARWPRLTPRSDATECPLPLITAEPHLLPVSSACVMPGRVAALPNKTTSFHVSVAAKFLHGSDKVNFQ
jgi:hypothetical protein